MKVKFECKVESKTKIEETIIQFLAKIYEFLPNEEGYFSQIAITATAPKPEKFKTGFSQLPGHLKDSLIYFNIDHDFKDEIVEDFQRLEGLFAFSANLRKIDWSDILIEMIPETEEEEKQVKLKKFGFKPEIRNDDREITQNDIGQILMRSAIYEPLSVYFSFFREGSNDFLARRFINAFFNFYYILEAIYGNNQWRNYKVRQEFEKSREFVKFLRKGLKHLKAEDSREYDKLAKQVRALKDHKGNPLKKRMGANGIIHLIVDTRGALHHFSMDEDRQQGSLFKQEDYFALGYILRGLAGETLNELSKALDKVYFKIKRRKEIENGGPKASSS